MTTINAALVESFAEPPHYRAIPEPQARPGHEVADVLAAGLHTVTRGIAAGRHYAGSDALPMVPGVDGVVRRQNGQLAWVGGPDLGTMAERILIDPTRAVPLPAGADPAVVAATMNPALSSWFVLAGRVDFEPGMSVLVMGATGTSGSVAVKVARQFGAGRVIAAGRNRARLEELLSEGADEVIALTADEDATAAAFASAASEVDVVLDYVWGAPTELAMRAVLTARRDPTRPLDWVHIGGTGGPEIALPGAGLRSNSLRVSGSGFGSIPPEVLRRELPRLVDAIVSGTLAVRPLRTPLAEVEKAWAHTDVSGERTVLVP